MAHEPSPTLRRRELGARLRELRVEAGLTAEEVAGRLLCSTAKISRIETGGRGVSLRDVRDLCGIYGTDDAERERLMTMARESKQRGWWQEFDVPYKTFLGLEAAAASISDYDSGVVPGLLQTRDYARALVEGMEPKWEVGRVQQAVELRMIRQELLTKPDAPRFWTVVDEAALRRHVGGPEVMRAQLDALCERAALPNVTVQLIPFEYGAHPGLDSTFIILSFEERGASDVVYVEGLIGQFYLERDTDLQRYRQRFDDLRAIAFGPKDTVARIRAIQSDYEKLI